MLHVTRITPVLEAMLARQSEWAIHGAPDLEKAWALAAAAGIDLPRPQADAVRPELKAVLEQDAADIQIYNVQQTPTFFVNGKPLTAFGPEQLEQLVDAELKAAQVELGR